MSCPRCGGVSESDLRAAMVELVCNMAVIEGPYCHCDDINDPAHVNGPTHGIGTLDGQSHGPTSSAGRTV